MRSSSWMIFFFLYLLVHLANAGTKHFEFNIVQVNVTKFCQTKTIVAVNGMYPGPTIRIRQGDNVAVKVNNLINTNITIHWHGVNQHITGWSDGPEYITQCPIQRNSSYTYRFNVQQVGTLFWHAHNTLLRATVYGAFIIEPPRKKQPPYPFPLPYSAETILLGDWFSKDLEEIYKDLSIYGGSVEVARGFVINGKPGIYSCLDGVEREEIHEIKFRPGKTHLLRVINAALEHNLFFSIANHSMTVVEIDAAYTKPLNVTEVLICPGQTVSLLVNASQVGGRYFMAASPWNGGQPFQSKPALGIVNYVSRYTRRSSRPVLYALPDAENKALGESLQKAVRSLNSKEYPESVPQRVEKSFYQVTSLNVKPCVQGIHCLGPNGQYILGSLNNISFHLPSTSILEAYYNNIPGVYTTDFPDNPPNPYNYTGEILTNQQPNVGTRVSVIPYGANVQLVLQSNINVPANDSHPFHLHGFDFYIVGEGKGNFNAVRDEPTFNLLDPPRRNTALLPFKGWVALRFKADNPGVWFFHCHMDGHGIWGMQMAFIVQNGREPSQTLPPPPRDLPKC